MKYKDQYGENSKDAAYLCAQIGTYYFNASDFKKTEDYLFKALKIQNKSNDDNTKEDLINTYQFLSGLYTN